MYQQPKLEFYGTLRELTQVGTNGAADAVFINGISGNPGNGPLNEYCTQATPTSVPVCHFS